MPKYLRNTYMDVHLYIDPSNGQYLLLTSLCDYCGFPVFGVEDMDTDCAQEMMDLPRRL